MCIYYICTGKLSGMNENTTKLKTSEEKIDMKSVVTAVYRVANVVQVGPCTLTVQPNNREYQICNPDGSEIIQDS